MNIVPTSVKPQQQYKPEFYDPKQAMQKVESALAADTYTERTKNQKVHGFDPEQYLLMWEHRFQKHERSMRKLWEMYTTMHRRFRGVTISDQFGYFGTQPTTEGRWVEYQPDLDGEVHPINIVRPDIRANVSALLQIEVGVQISSPNQDARFHEIAQQLQLLADFIRRDMWTESERTLLFDGIQKEGTILHEIYKDLENARSHKVTLPTKLEQSYAVFNCEGCGLEGAKEIGPDEAESMDGFNIPCPECGVPSDVKVQSMTNYDVDENEIRTSEVGHRLWSGFNFIIDREGAKRNGIRSAKYLRTMELVERAELEDAYPQFTFESPFEWAFGLKCQHALASANWDMLYSSWMPSHLSPEWDLFQKNTNYLYESSYKNYISPVDWEFRDRSGKCKFRIKRGQSWKDAVHNSMGEDCKGFRYVYINERLIDIECAPEHEPNFRKVFTDCHFQRDSGSYHSVPHWDSVQLQDDVTLFNTLKVETTARNAVEPVWFNSTVFDINDFGRDYIPSKDGALDADGDTDIRKQVFKPPIAKSADAITEQLIFLLGIRREISGVQPALLGESQPGQPYAAQRQQLDQAFGLLTSAAKSNAQMEVESTKQALTFCFEHWTIEQFQAVASRFGEHWDETTVAALASTDLERDVEISYVNGTEQPQSRLAKEIKFFNGLRELMPFIQGGVVPPEILTQLLKTIDKFAGFDFDLSGAETNDALAQKRFRKLSEVCAEFKPLTRDDIDEYKQAVIGYEPVQMPAMPTGQDPNAQPPAEGGDESGAPPAEGADPMAMAQPAIQMKPITAWDMLVEELAVAADIYISSMEDFGAQAAFFLPMVTQELARPEPNYVFVDMLEWLIDQFNQRALDAQMAAMANDPTLTAEKDAADAAGKSEEEGRKHEKETAEKNHERDVDKMTVQEASKENDRDFEREKMAHELLTAKSEQGGNSAKKKPSKK